MHSFEVVYRSTTGIPLATAWLLDDLATYRGKQELFERQTPERLATLRESAIIESSVSSNRIENIEVDTARIGTILFGRGIAGDRNEEEVRGYRAALELVHARAEDLELTPDTARELHHLVRGDVWDAGAYKERAEPIVERRPDGRSVTRFEPVAAELAPELLEQTLRAGREAISDRRLPGLVAVALTNLDFLCVHPFRDGNGRVSRLLLLLHAYQAGHRVGRYVSIERAIERAKDRYYETLHRSSQGWHEAHHDPWPYVDYVLYTVREVYRELELRWETSAEPRGTKTALVHAAINAAGDQFTVAQVERACPGVSRELIRRVLRARPDVRAIGRGPGARWRRER